MSSPMSSPMESSIESSPMESSMSSAVPPDSSMESSGASVGAAAGAEPPESSLPPQETATKAKMARRPIVQRRCFTFPPSMDRRASLDGVPAIQRGRQSYPCHRSCATCGSTKLGREDSNPQYRDQNPVCCLLHHSREQRPVYSPTSVREQRISRGGSELGAGIPQSAEDLFSAQVLHHRLEQRGAY